MQRRTKIIIAVIVLILLALIAMLFLLKPPAAAPAPAPINDTTTNGNVNQPASQNTNTRPAGNINVGTSTNTPVPQVDPTIGLRNTARSFAELFGSSSTEGDYQNIVDAQYYMSATVKAWAEKYVSEQRAKPSTGEFSGTTTRALSVLVSSVDEDAGTALVIVKTRRIETGASIASQNVYFQDLTLDFIKVDGVWKVDRFTWVPL